MTEKNNFDVELIKAYPRSNRKVAVGVRTYNLTNEANGLEDKAQTTFISPHGMEFHSQKAYAEGTLLKINICLPDYWNLKQKFVDYHRIDRPLEFRVLAKVIASEDLGKRGKKKLITVQTVNIDGIDEQVLKSYLQEAK